MKIMKAIKSFKVIVLLLIILPISSVILMQLFIKPSLEHFFDEPIISRHLSFGDKLYSEHISSDGLLYANVLEHNTSKFLMSSLTIDKGFSPDYNYANHIITKVHADDLLIFTTKYSLKESHVGIKYETQFRTVDNAWRNLISTDIQSIHSSSAKDKGVFRYVVTFDKLLTLHQVIAKIESILFTTPSDRVALKTAFYQHVFEAIPYGNTTSSTWSIYFSPLSHVGDNQIELSLSIKREASIPTDTLISHYIK